MDQQKRNRLWPLWLLLPLGTVYYFCKFILPGYSFTALVFSSSTVVYTSRHPYRR